MAWQYYDRNSVSISVFPRTLSTLNKTDKSRKSWNVTDVYSCQGPTTTRLTTERAWVNYYTEPSPSWPTVSYIVVQSNTQGTQYMTERKPQT